MQRLRAAGAKVGDNQTIKIQAIQTNPTTGVRQIVAIPIQTTSAAASPAAATQAIEPLHLSELNQRSANLGCWEVGVFSPCIEDFQWTDKNTGQQKQIAAYRCLLVSCRNRSQYVAAQQTMRNGNKSALDRVYQRFQANTYFRMSNVQLNGNMQQEFMNTPQTFVVLIPGTKFDPLLNSSTGQHVQP